MGTAPVHSASIDVLAYGASGGQGSQSGGGGGSSYAVVGNGTFGGNPDRGNGVLYISWTVPGPTPTPTAQLPRSSCVTVPNGSKIKRSTMKRLLKAGCTTNAGQRVAVKLEGKKTVAKLVCQKPKKKAKPTRALTSYGSGYRYCSAGELKIATKNKKGTAKITWFAPATSTHWAYRKVKSYKVK